jgi:chloramphenicol 3-O phosphotransferase
LPDRSTELVQVESGKILIINGTSSSGKTTFAKALRPALGEPFCYYASDQLADGGFRSRIESAEEPAFAHAGNNLIVEHIVEEQSWADDLGALLRPFDVFWIGLHAPWEELMRRERERKDRTIGEACFHLKTHLYTHYDIEIQSTRPLVESVPEVVQAWNNRFDVRRPPKR